jgi:AraC-like DNA-binding protein
MRHMKPSWLDRISPCIRPAKADGQAHSHTAHGRVPPNWTEPLRVIYDHEIVLFAKGSFDVEVAGRRYACPADSFVIVPPGQWHASWETAGRPGYRYWSHFDWACAGDLGRTPIMTFHPARPRPSLFRKAPAFVPPGVLHGRISAPARAYELAERLSHLQSHGTAHERVASRALLLELLLELLDTRSRKVAAADRKEELAGQVRTLLEAHLEQHGQLRIQDLMAERLGHSYAHLCRLFRAKHGIPPLKYLNALCVSRARLLLRDTELGIGEIARRLGFRDPLYFSQLFRKMAGQPPSAFRRSTRS